MSIDMNVGGLGMDVSVTTTEGGSMTGTESNSFRSTTTTTSGSGRTEVFSPDPVPGYSGVIGCAYPMDPIDFEDASRSIGSKSFEDSKLTMAKQVTKYNCLSADQVKRVMQRFDFESTRLDYAKFAYDYTYDPGNYFKVNDAFEFESSIEDLDEYISSR